jgi:hypothetical protein
MDLKIYYQKIREQETTLPDGDVLVVSKETQDGGKAGVRTEVPRRVAAKLLVDGTVRVATPEEAEQFRVQQAEAKRAAIELVMANRVQVSVIPASELKQIRESLQPKE